MLQICSDKSQLLQALDDGVFQTQIALLRTQRCPQLLAIMIETCYCDGVPIPQNQRRWAFCPESPDTYSSSLRPRTLVDQGRIH